MSLGEREREKKILHEVPSSKNSHTFLFNHPLLLITASVFIHEYPFSNGRVSSIFFSRTPSPPSPSLLVDRDFQFLQLPRQAKANVCFKTNARARRITSSHSRDVYSSRAPTIRGSRWLFQQTFHLRHFRILREKLDETISVSSR